MMWKELPFSKNLFGSEAALSNFSSFASRSSLFSISSVTFSQRSMAWKRKYIVCFIQYIKQKFILIKKILENFLIYFSSYQKIHSLPKIDFTQKGFFSFKSKNLMIPEFLKILDIEKRIFVLKYTTQKYRNSEKYSNVIPQTVWHSTRWCCIWWPCPALGYLASPGHSKPSPISPGGSTVHLHSAKTSHRYQRQENNLHVLKINKTLLHHQEKLLIYMYL